jgi:predicted transglutaminase-like cysteine proteinase
MLMQLISVFRLPEGSSWQWPAAMIWRLPKAAFVTGVVAVIAAFSALAAAAPASADAVRPSFLRSVETRSTNLSPFTRWNAVLSRSTEEATRVERTDCRFAGTAVCSYGEWLQFLHSLRRASKWEQLVAVNGYMNARPYIADDKNYGMQDYWATPGEFLARSGDCEDFAIAKFLSLKQLGWTDDELRLVAVKDRKLGVGHAVLVAYFGGKIWLLDNQLEHVTDLDTVRHYEPVYSINQSHWWLHKKNERPGNLVLTVGLQSAR